MTSNNRPIKCLMTNESLVSNENKNESLGLRLEMQNAAIKMFFIARGRSYKILPQRSGLPSCWLKPSLDVQAARKFGLFSRQLAGCRNNVPQNSGYQCGQSDSAKRCKFMKGTECPSKKTILSLHAADEPSTLALVTMQPLF